MSCFLNEPCVEYYCAFWIAVTTCLYILVSPYATRWCRRPACWVRASTTCSASWGRPSSVASTWRPSCQRGSCWMTTSPSLRTERHCSTHHAYRPSHWASRQWGRYWPPSRGSRSYPYGCGCSPYKPSPFSLTSSWWAMAIPWQRGARGG